MHHDAAGRLEIRLTVTLPASEDVARAAAVTVAEEIDAAVRTGLGVAAEVSRPAPNGRGSP